MGLQYIEKGNIKCGQKVLIYGASGTYGTIALQLAKLFGAEVTGVCSTSNLELVKSLGVDKVIDYTGEDSIHIIERYDFILDSVGKMKSSELKNECKKALTTNGKYISIDDGKLELRSERLDMLKEFIDAGYIKTFIDRIYPLDRISEAHEYVGKGHKKVGVAINVKHTN